jgi:hypothetical protein
MRKPFDGLDFGGADILVCPNPRDFGELSRAVRGILATPSGFELIRSRAGIPSTHELDGRQECLPHH